MRRRLVRWRGLLWLAAARVAGRARGGGSRQLALQIWGVAVPVALLVVVSAVALGSAGGTTVASPDVDYWIVPEGASARSAVVPVEGPRLGDVHRTSERLSARTEVDHATPVLTSVLRLRSAGAEARVLVVGVVPDGEPVAVAGVSTGGLAPGDPHFASGSYDGPWTGEAVLSPAAAELLDATEGTTLGTGANRRFAVAAVSDAGGRPTGDLPVAVVHLAELQSITGAADGDQADQLLVSTSDPGVRGALADVYPRTVVLARGDLTAHRVLESDVGLAMGVGALLVALVVGALSTASTLGMAVAADARRRAALAALGFSGRSQAGLVAAETMAVATAGGTVGVALGGAAVPIANALARRAVGVDRVAAFHPALLGYGLGVALVVGLLAVPYLLVLGRRTTTVADLDE